MRIPSFCFVAVAACLLSSAPARADVRVLGPDAYVRVDGDESRFTTALDAEGSRLALGRIDASASEPAGRVYVYARGDGDSYVPEATLTLEGGGATHRHAFGADVALSGDRLAVAVSHGPVVIFERDAEGWSERERIAESAAGTGAYFDGRIALSGDMLVVTSGADIGPYVFDLATQPATFAGRITSPQVTDLADGFGDAVAIDGESLVVGASNRGDYGKGSIFLYARNGDSKHELFEQPNPHTLVGGDFGRAIDVHKSLVLVGEPVLQFFTGAFMLYAREGNALRMLAELTPAGIGENTSFARDVAIRDATIVATSAPGLDGPAPPLAYVFSCDAGGFREWARLTGAEDGVVGLIVTINDTHIVTEALRVRDGHVYESGFYVYDRARLGTPGLGCPDLPADSVYVDVPREPPPRADDDAGSAALDTTDTPMSNNTSSDAGVTTPERAPARRKIETRGCSVQTSSPHDAWWTRGIALSVVTALRRRRRARRVSALAACLVVVLAGCTDVTVESPADSPAHGDADARPDAAVEPSSPDAGARGEDDRDGGIVGPGETAAPTDLGPFAERPPALEVAGAPVSDCTGAANMTPCTTPEVDHGGEAFCLNQVCKAGPCDDGCGPHGPSFPWPWGRGVQLTRIEGDEPVVRDEITHLMWQGCIAGERGPRCRSGHALDYVTNPPQYCADLEWAGYDDWVLPDIYALVSLETYETVANDVSSSGGTVVVNPWVDQGQSLSPVAFIRREETTLESSSMPEFGFGPLNVGTAGGLVQSFGGNGSLTCMRRTEPPRPLARDRFAFASAAGERVAYDRVSTLMWAPRPPMDRDLGATKKDCADLVWAGLDDWHVPTLKQTYSVFDLDARGFSRELGALSRMRTSTMRTDDDQVWQIESDGTVASIASDWLAPTVCVRETQVEPEPDPVVACEGNECFACAASSCEPLTADAISVGASKSCAIRSGHALCWGAGSPWGGYGDDIVVHESCNGVDCMTAAVPGAVGLGTLLSVTDSCAIDAAQHVWCWGHDTDQGLGDGASTEGSESPVRVDFEGTVAEIERATDGGCLRTTEGVVYCWGSNLDGRLGDGATMHDGMCDRGVDCAASPVAVLDLSDAIDIDVDSATACAVRADHTLWCWGTNVYGKLGLAATDQDAQTIGQSSTPVKNASVSDVRLLALGYEHVCIANGRDEVWCWGNDSRGQLGDGATPHGTTCYGYDCATAPVRVKGLSNVTALTAGASHTCALTSTGAVYCWGSSERGQLTAGELVDVHEPMRADAAHAYRAISAQGDTTCGIRTDGHVYCWGLADYGALGDGLPAHEACDMWASCSRVPVAVRVAPAP